MRPTMDSERMEQEKNISLIRNLRDAGCRKPLIDKILALHESGNFREELRLLAAQRSGLLEKVHAAQKQVDCLDYFIFHMQQEHITNSGR